MPGYDLHTHSTCSDGTCEPEQVVAMARERDLAGIALTDHDTTAGVARARAAAGTGTGTRSRGRLAVLTGCELSAEHDGDPVHVLAFGFDPAEPRFKAARKAIRDERVSRAGRMVERLRSLGVPITLERVLELAGGGSVGRPHIAEAMVEAGVVPDLGAAFVPGWIGTGGRAYVAKRAVSPVQAVGLVRGAGGAAVLAHPSVHAGARAVPETLIRDMAAAGLAGIEVDHPDQDEAQRARWRALAGELGLAVTGGSDDHGARSGYRLGVWRTPEDVVAALLAASPAAGLG